jgi:hypothetical protein
VFIIPEKGKATNMSDTDATPIPQVLPPTVRHHGIKDAYEIVTCLLYEYFQDNKDKWNKVRTFVDKASECGFKLEGDLEECRLRILSMDDASLREDNPALVEFIQGIVKELYNLDWDTWNDERPSSEKEMREEFLFGDSAVPDGKRKKWRKIWPFDFCGSAAADNPDAANNPTATDNPDAASNPTAAPCTE